MCFCVSRIVCVCILVGLLKCSCCAAKHTEDVEKFNSINITDELIFLKHIFLKYGNNGSMNFDGFQELLHNVGLVKVFSALELEKQHHEEHEHHHHHEKNEHDEVAPKLDDGDNLGQPLPHESLNHDEVSHVDRDSHQKELFNLLNEMTMGEFNESQLLKFNSKNKCLSATETLYNYKLARRPTLTSTDFMYICPAIIFDLDHSNCLINKDHDHEHDHAQIIYKQPGVEVWLFAIGAVIIISLCGLFSVAMVPLIQRVFYQSVLQFLVGLAIGSLSGDSLLHLLPHAMAGLNHHDHQGSSSHGNGHGDHSETESHMWRGLVALLGIYAFYLAERLLTRVSSCYKKNGERKDSLPKSVARKPEKVPRKTQAIHKIDAEQSRTVGEKLSHHKHGSYGFNFDQLEMEDMQKLNESTKEDNLKSEYRSASDSEILGEKESDLMDELPTKAFSASLTSKSGKLDDSGANETLVMKKNDKDRSALMIAVRGNVAGGSASSLHFHHSHHHHHHHHHSHLSTPGNGAGTISSVAWMVIMGDGLHNFCDGLAIGAAFAAGLSSGISTTIAVFCHELPHELGDFAMLIKAGMSVKQALIYNGLSSILCFVGMIVGVLLGNVGSATLWVFAGAAGMFLYIALVDMLPELTTQEEETSGITHLLLQALGISTGISIMLVIAIYEHDLRHLLS